MSDDEVWRDDPIRSIGDDQLNRAHVARHVADLVVRAHSWDSSLVFSLTGPWGSGKSSLLEMISEFVVTEHEAWTIVRFTPWASSDVDGLLAEFYASLSSALPPDRGKKARNALAVCAQVAGPALKLVPIAGNLFAEGAQLAADALSRRTPWHHAFKAAAHAIRDAGTPVLVVVDDLDRLQHDELLAVLKVVRLLGRFPGVTYLLAYDEQTLFATLSEHQSQIQGQEQSRRFMEKIVQYPVIVPPMTPFQILSRLEEGLTRVADELGRPLTSSEHRLSRLRGVFERQLTTPRSIDRFLAQVRFDISHHKPDEIDDVDLILLAFLRLQFPNLYSALPRWRWPLTGTATHRQSMTQKDKEPDWIKLVELAGSGESEQMDANDVLEVLFPAMTKHGGGASLRGVGNSEYFSRYFVHTVPEDDVADADIAEALLEANEKGERQSLISELLTSTYPGRADLALSKLWQASAPDTTGPQHNPQTALLLLSAVMSVLTRLNDAPSSFVSLRDRAIYWAANIVENLPVETDPEALAASLRCCDDLMLRLRVIWSTKTNKIVCPRSVESVAQALATEALTAFLENLRQKDNADSDRSTLFPLMFIHRYGSVSVSREAILADLGTAYTVEDLAARCVKVVTLLSANPVSKIDGFEQDIFALFAPAKHCFYNESIVNDLDMHDVTWANRRAYARGRAAAP